MGTMTARDNARDRAVCNVDGIPTINFASSHIVAGCNCPSNGAAIDVDNVPGDISGRRGCNDLAAAYVIIDCAARNGDSIRRSIARRIRARNTAADQIIRRRPLDVQDIGRSIARQGASAKDVMQHGARSADRNRTARHGARALRQTAVRRPVHGAARNIHNAARDIARRLCAGIVLFDETAHHVIVHSAAREMSLVARSIAR